MSGGVARQLLVGILESDSLVHKLIGMQLMVESNALSIFKALAAAEVEPVLTELLPYYERDEARHVGLGVMYTPKLLGDLSRVEAAGVAAFQLRCVGLLISAGLPMRAHFRNLGMDPRHMAKHVVALQDEIVKQMRAAPRTNATQKSDERAAPSARRGLGGVLNPHKGLGPKVLDFIHPPNGIASANPLHRAVLRLWTEGARIADRALA